MYRIVLYGYLAGVPHSNVLYREGVLILVRFADTWQVYSIVLYSTGVLIPGRCTVPHLRPQPPGSPGCCHSPQSPDRNGQTPSPACFHRLRWSGLRVSTSAQTRPACSMELSGPCAFTSEQTLQPISYSPSIRPGLQA